MNHARTISSWKALLWTGTLLAVCVNIGRITVGLRLATADDLGVARGLSDPAFALGNRLYDFGIGRFYADVKFALLEGLMSVSSDVAHGALRIALFVSAAATAAWFCWEWTRRWRTALGVLLTITAWMHVSLSYQALLSHPFLWVGWAAVWTMGALALRPDSAFSRAAILFAFFTALAVHESNAVFVVWPILVRFATAGRSGAATLWPTTAACMVILSVYGLLALALRHASSGFAEQYSGTHLAFDPRAMGFALAVYSCAGFPGLTSWVGMGAASRGGLLLTPDEWWQRVAERAGAADWLVAALFGLAIWTVMPVTAGTRVRRRDWLMWVAVSFAVVAPNLLLAATSKYQVWAHQRMWPYYYSGMSYLAWVLVVVVGTVHGLRAINSSARAGMARVVLAVFGALIALGLTAASREAEALLRERPLTHINELTAGRMPER